MDPSRPDIPPIIRVAFDQPRKPKLTRAQRAARKAARSERDRRRERQRLERLAAERANPPSAPPRPTGVVFETVRRRLGFSSADLWTAIACGWVVALPNGRIERDEVARVLPMREALLAEVRLEDLLNAPDAAALLQIPVAVFRRAVDDAVVAAYAQGSWKWGTFALFRRRDLLDAQDAVVAASRRGERLRAMRRPAATARAAGTRDRHVAEAAAFDRAIDPLRDGQDADPITHSLLAYGELAEHLAEALEERRHRAKSAARRDELALNAAEMRTACARAARRAIEIGHPSLRIAFVRRDRVVVCAACERWRRQRGASLPADAGCEQCTLDLDGSSILVASGSWRVRVPFITAVRWTFAGESETIEARGASRDDALAALKDERRAAARLLASGGRPRRPSGMSRAFWSGIMSDKTDVRATHEEAFERRRVTLERRPPGRPSVAVPAWIASAAVLEREPPRIVGDVSLPGWYPARRLAERLEALEGTTCG